MRPVFLFLDKTCQITACFFIYFDDQIKGTFSQYSYGIESAASIYIECAWKYDAGFFGKRTFQM